MAQDQAKLEALIEDLYVVNALREWAPLSRVQISPDPTWHDLSLYLDGAGLVLMWSAEGQPSAGANKSDFSWG